MQLREFYTVLCTDDVAGTAADARAVLAPVLAKPAYASAHRIMATGHAHIHAVIDLATQTRSDDDGARVSERP